MSLPRAHAALCTCAAEQLGGWGQLGEARCIREARCVRDRLWRVGRTRGRMGCADDTDREAEGSESREMCRGLPHTSAADLSSRLASRVSPSSSSATTPPREKPGGSAVVRPISSSLSPASARMARCLPPVSIPLPFQGPRGLTVTRHVMHRPGRCAAPRATGRGLRCEDWSRARRSGVSTPSD